MAKKEIEDVFEFIVVTPIRHNDKDYQTGETVALSEKESGLLLEWRAIKSVNQGSLTTDETPQESEAV